MVQFTENRRYYFDFENYQNYIRRRGLKMSNYFNHRILQGSNTSVEFAAKCQSYVDALHKNNERFVLF